ncbi:general odorant-binding protein 67-like [Ochlerotatus camptorhynchus]|uniref:general odorant-binding protein 67-like n=1 Tax=Ochlerotatus camptorhynchus TaxID=644619 RepID=UPI0031DAADD5
MTRTTPSTLIVVLLLAGALAQPKPDDPSCIQGNRKRIPDCCRMPFQVDQSILNRCIAENPNIALPAPGVQRTEGCCLIQCILTTVNAFNNNAIDKEAAKRATAETIGSDPNFSPLVDGVIDECYNLVNNNATFTATPVSATPGRPGCSFVPEGFINCVKSKLFQQCPAAVWTQDADCDQLKQKISTGCSFYSLMG